MAQFRLAVSIVALALLSLLAACGNTGGGVASFNYSGTWVGTIVDSVGGPGTIVTTMSQSGSDIVGTWQATFASGNNGGILAGLIRTNDVLVELYPSNPALCPYAAVAQRSGSTLSGTYAAFNCTEVVTGTLSITKQ